jgi:hypothetical protein
MIFFVERVRPAAMGLLLGVHFLLGAWMIHASPSPHIDVFVFQQEGPRELLAGRNPYEMRFPDIYRSDLPRQRQVYGPGLARDGKLQFGFPYTPLSLLLALAGYGATGDHRYAQLLATTCAGALIACLRPGRVPALASALFLFTPRSYFVLTRGWTEPLVVFLFAAVVFAAVRRLRILPIALGLFVASKQYLVFALPAVPLLAAQGRRISDGTLLILQALVVAALITLPLALWNPQAFWHSTAVVQQVAPYRTDSLSYLNAWLDLLHALPHDGSLPDSQSLPSMLPAFAALACGMLFAIWRAPRSPAGFAVAIALIFLPFIAFNKQAFANYYYFVIGALCCALAASNKTTAAVEPPRLR